MKKRHVLSAIVFGSMLAITGCGDDPAEGESSSTGSGGSRGPSSSTCEAICSSSCVFQGVDPDGQQCLTNCQVGFAQFDDECGPRMDAYLDCLESVNCDPQPNDCVAQATAWGTCVAVVFQ